MTTFRALLALLLIAATAPASAELTDDLAAYYPLDNLEDAVGSVDLTNNGGAAFAAGKVGNAVDLEVDSAQYLSAADAPALSMGSGVQWTITFWARAESLPGGGNSLVTKGGATEYFFDAVSNGSTRLLAGSGFKVAVGPTVDLSTWRFFAIVYDGADYSVSMDDGVPVSGGSGDTPDGAGAFQIGSRSDVGGFTWDGMVDEVGIWKRALTSDEITALYNGGDGLAFQDFVEEEEPPASSPPSRLGLGLGIGIGRIGPHRERWADRPRPAFTLLTLGA